MDCSVHSLGGIQLAAPAGELDVAVAPELRELLKDVIEKGATQIVVDMRGVIFIDSSCLGVLVNAHKFALSKGAVIKFAQPNDQVRKIFELTRIDKHLAFYAAVDDAVNSFSEPS
jgi:anti-sigma B factor antagonist